MKLLKRDRSRLIEAIAKLRRGADFLLSDRVAVMTATGSTANDVFSATLSDTRYHSIDKEIGPELALLWTGLAELERMSLEGVSAAVTPDTTLGNV